MNDQQRLAILERNGRHQEYKNANPVDSNLQGKTIVVVDDEFAHRKLLELIFNKVGATVRTAEGHMKGMELLETRDPDLMLIDIMMPDVDGITLTHQVRQISDVPIIIISAKERPEDVVAGLQAGADDYIVKPYDFKVLVERTKAVLRRGTNGLHAPEQTTFKDDNLFIDLQNRLVIVEGQLISLDNVEFNLLGHLVRHANQPCTFSDLLINVWGEECSHNPEYIHAYIWRLRQNIELNPKNPSYIVTPGTSAGFIFVFSDC
jgi:DNA-binding response OmpR family regulator